jgi:hypothetical protein
MQKIAISKIFLRLNWFSEKQQVPQNARRIRCRPARVPFYPYRVLFP